MVQSSTAVAAHGSPDQRSVVLVTYPPLQNSGKAKESRTHIVGECEIYKEERDVLLIGEMRKIDECGMEKLGTLDSSEKTIAILGNR